MTTEYHWTGVPLAVLRGDLTQEEFVMQELALGTTDKPLADASDLDDDARAALRLIRTTIDTLDGPGGSGPGVQVFERALNFLYGHHEAAELLRDPSIERPDDEFEDPEAELELTSPDFGITGMSLEERTVAEEHANEVADEVYGITKPGRSAAQAYADCLVDEIFNQ